MFVTIRLRGALGRRFGFVHKCIASSTAQAIRYLEVNNHAFRNWVLEASKRGIVFNVTINSAYELDENEMIDPLPEASTVSISALFSGAGGGNISWLKVIAGVGLLVAGLAGVGFLGLGPLQLAITGGLLLVSGLMGKRTEKPEEAEDTRSFIFSGQTNVSASGGRVPVVFGGPILIGSTVISAAVRSYLV
jgi:predicted phage tail protein